MTQRSLSALRIGNFKAFADTQRIPLKPITLIFGPNSAGKSSFIHSLAFAHEAEFGREKRGTSRLDVGHTDIGGNSIDLGGFRQFVHGGRAANRVEWGAELNVAGLDSRMQELLHGVDMVSLSILLGMQLDEHDEPVPNADPRVEAMDVMVDGEELMHFSYRGQVEEGAVLRLDRLPTGHPVVKRLIEAIIQGNTTLLEVTDEDFRSAGEAVSDLLPRLLLLVRRLFPDMLRVRPEEGEQAARQGLIAVSQESRSANIAEAVEGYLPGLLEELVKGISRALSGELQRLQYLGPIRSLPPRHLAFTERSDVDWYAGGAYAWDVVRRDDTIRKKVDTWLGSDKLKTPYGLFVRSYVAEDQIQAPLEERLDSLIVSATVDPETGEETDDPAIIGDTELEAQAMTLEIMAADIDRVRELVLWDMRSGSFVTHRDVGIGISQVLPVLVMAYGSQNKLLAIEQPEIHLHPALQAELGDVFIESALGESQNTFILETHSEHLILRLLRRIRETTEGELPEGAQPIRPEDIQVLYVQPEAIQPLYLEDVAAGIAEPEQHGCRIVALSVDEQGEFVEPWPDGFFPERARELF